MGFRMKSVGPDGGPKEVLLQKAATTPLLPERIKDRRDGGGSDKGVPAMFTMRLIFRRKCTTNLRREWNAMDTGQKEAGLVQASRFFGTSDGYQLTKSIARRLGEEIVNALHLGQRSRASDLLSQLDNGGRALKLRSFVPILQYCAEAPDPMFTFETWKFMMEKDVRLSGKCYFFAIKALCKGGYLDEAFSILNIQREHSETCPTLRAYNYLLKASIQMNSSNHVNEVLHLIEQEGKDIITYYHLIKLAVLQQNLAAVHEIWKDCVNYYSLSIITLRKFIWAFSILRDVKSAYKALQQMVAAVSQHKCNTTGAYEEKLCNSRLDVPIPFSNDLARYRYVRSNYISVPYSPVYSKENDTNKGVGFGTEVRGVADAGISSSEQPFSRPVMKLLMGSFNDIISACAHSRNIMFVEQLLLQMRILGLEPSTRTYDGYVRALVSVKTFHDGLELLNIMQQKNMKPSDSTLAALSVSCSRSLQLDLAEIFLDQVSKKSNDVNLFNEFLRACDAVDKPERAIRAWARMKDKNLMPDIQTYALLFSLFGNVAAPYDDPNIMSQAEAARRISAIEMDMTRNGIQHNLLSLKNLLAALGREKMIPELIKYVHFAEEQCTYSSTNLGTQIYNVFLHSLNEAKECETAFEIFKKMISSGLSPDYASYSIMIDCCSIMKCPTSACALLSRMIRDGFPVNQIAYGILTKIMAKCEGFGEAFRIIDLAIADSLQPDTIFYNEVLKTASQRGRIDVVELIIEKMHRNRIQPDPSTCRHVFSVYIVNDLHSTAMEALRVVSLRMISDDDRVLEEYRLMYEDLILDEEMKAEFKIMEIFREAPFLVVALLNLRWFAILVSPPSWLPNESPWAKMISSNYSAQLRGEWMMTNK